MSVKKTSESVLYGGDISLPSNCNYGKFIIDTYTSFNDKVALIDGTTGEKITYKEIVQKTINVANVLKKMGIKRGDVAAICSENRIEFVITCYALMYIGAVANFINKAYSIEEVVHTLGISKPKIIFLSPETYKAYNNILIHLRFVQIFVYGKSVAHYVTHFHDLVKNNADINLVKPEDIKAASETAIITYSSGTTGLPKGVKWTHGGLIITAKQPISTDRDLIYLMIAPWTNTMGYIVTHDLLTKGKTVVFLPKYSEKLYLQTVEKYKINFLIAVPPLIVILSKSTSLKDYNLSSVEFIYSGGATLDAKTIIDVKKRFPNLKHVLQSYGMSEATGGITQESVTENKIGSVGKALPGVALKVVDIESGKILGPNKRGEVCIKGPILFGGYVGRTNPEDYDEQGFYKTGDIAYYDEDGYIFIADRLKEIIKYKGYQVGPTELEAILLGHPAVKDVGVIGVPDQVAGELPLAFVVKQPGATVNEKELIDFVAKKVSPWKKLRGGVRFVEEIPKNGTGKILRRQLQALVAKPVSKL